LSYWFFIIKVYSFTFSKHLLLPCVGNLLFYERKIYSVLNNLNFTLLVVCTFLSFLLWGVPLSFDWNLLLFLLPFEGFFYFFISLVFYEFIIAYKFYLSIYFWKYF